MEKAGFKIRRSSLEKYLPLATEPLRHIIIDKVLAIFTWHLFATNSTPEATEAHNSRIEELRRQLESNCQCVWIMVYVLKTLSERLGLTTSVALGSLAKNRPIQDSTIGR
jgi:hypothetical protein